MARRGTYRLWLALLVVAAGIGLTGDASVVRPPTHAAAAVSFTPTAVDAAIVPARTEAGSTADAARHGSGRWLLPLVAALLGLAALPGARAGTARPPACGRQPLRARRHAIALRAPPSVQLA